MEKIPYAVTSAERLQIEETELATELNELKAKIEENEMVYGIKRPRNISSVPIPKDVAYFKRERELLLNRGLEVCEAHPATIQAEVMQEELTSCDQSDYTPESLPLLLHQFYLDRIRQLVQCKHMHQVRWARFHEGTSSLEALYSLYQDRLKLIMSEYNDCTQRAQRLAVVRESFLNNDNNAMLHLKKDDVTIYLRWMVTHFRSTKRFHQYMRVLQWLPVVHRDAVALETLSYDAEDFSTSARIPSKYQNDEFHTPTPGGSTVSLGRSPLDARSLPTKDTDVVFKATQPLSLDPLTLTTQALPALQLSTTYTATGGGLAPDEQSLYLPVHTCEVDSFRALLAFLARNYHIDTNVDGMTSSAEEMELYAEVNRKFRHVFSRQEHMKTLKAYDRIEVGQENWGVDNCQHALKKESNWLPFISLHPEKDLEHEKKLGELRMRKNVDELLRVQARFISVSDAEKAQDALREHASVVRDPIVVQSFVISTGHQGAGSRKPKPSPQVAALWKKIYSNPELYRAEDDVETALQELEDGQSPGRNQRSRPATGKKRKDSYDYIDTIQMLGLDEGDQDSSDPSSIQGAFLALLQLRHLRIRDLQRTCLSILNYFRSVERTLTINGGGLSVEANRMTRSSPQDHRKEVSGGGQGGGGGLGSHHYLHYTPRDYKLSEAEFMEFSEVENHDDFYSEEDGRVHVQDQRGYFIVYDVALDDLRALEEELLLMASSFIEKDRDHCSPRATSGRKRQPQSAGDFDISRYSHQEVDRFAVLLDAWTNEAALLECKKQVLDCYLEAYHHVFDRDEKRTLAQVITNLMYCRPRYDFTASYFTKVYRLECVCLRLQAQLVKQVLDQMIQDQRKYINQIHRGNSSEYGLPHKILPKQPIAVNLNRSALMNVYLLEFHPCLAVIGQLPTALKHALRELFHVTRPPTTTDVLTMERKLLERALVDWEKMPAPGASFSPNTQRDLFRGDCIEDPQFVAQIATELVDRIEQESLRKSQKDRQISMLNAFCRTLQLVTLRYRLIDVAWESEILSKVYLRQAGDLGFDECHLYLRFVQFEYASFKDKAGKPPPIFITAVQEDDSLVDRYTPNNLYLAIHELDESNVGRFCFTGYESVAQMLKGFGVENLQVILLAQLTHRNALMCAVQQVETCRTLAHLELTRARPSSPLADTKSERSSATVQTALTGMSSGTTTATAMATRLTSHHHVGLRNKTPPDAFLSLQLEKAPSRDLMLNEFVVKKQQMEVVLKNPDEMGKLKRRLLTEYSVRLQNRISQYSLRGQLLAYYNSIQGLLADFPTIRDNYFQLGHAKEKKTAQDTVEGLQTEPRSLKSRPRRVLSADGRHVLNLWFLPHPTEALVLYKELDDDDCRAALASHVRLVAALHDTLQYLTAHAALGSYAARSTARHGGLVTADWGGAEGIGTELLEIQRQVDHLEHKTDPTEVSQFLVLRRDVMFLEFDTAVRHSMRETFLATGKMAAYKAVTGCMRYPLLELSNTQRPGFTAPYLNTPEPLEARDGRAKTLYPWRSFINRGGLYPVHFWQWGQISYNIRLCLAGLNDTDRHVANGEILALSLLIEDVLKSGQPDHALRATLEVDEDADAVRNVTSAMSGSRMAADVAVASQQKKASTGSLSRIRQPLESYKLIRKFLVLSKRLEMYKYHWGRQKLHIDEIQKPAEYTRFCREYRKEVLYPTLQSVARRYGQADLYDGLVSELEPLAIPHGAGEMEIRNRQLVRLLELQESHMIREVHRKVSRELNMVLAERQREEGALPTDLWKRPAIKESMTLNRPHIADAFVDRLMAQCQDGDADKVTFSKDHLSDCLATLANDVMNREKNNFESYSMYYENLLRTHHQLLYQREQEVKHLRDELRSAQSEAEVEVQCRLAAQSQELLLEVTAWRAKVQEMRQDSLNQERVVRDRVRHEYDKLVHNMFTSSFDVMHKFDEYRLNLVGEVKQLINSVKSDTVQELDARRAVSGVDAAVGVPDRSSAITEIAGKLEGQEKENHNMNVLLLKTKALNTWRQMRDRRHFLRQVEDRIQEADGSRKECKKQKDLQQEERVLLREQIQALRDALRDSEQECQRIRKDLEKELKVKEENAHVTQQKALSRRQLEEARKSNVDQLLDEVEDKEQLLQSLASQRDKNRRLQELNQNKVQRNVDRIRKQLMHERSLKQNAFQRVDELQTQVYEQESTTYSRPHTAHAALSRNRSRMSSAGAKRPATRASCYGWAPAVTWPANRSLTPGPEPPNHANKIQRPKTTAGRLRSRIAEQLLNELDPPDHHETLVQLREIEQMQKKVNTC